VSTVYYYYIPDMQYTKYEHMIIQPVYIIITVEKKYYSKLLYIIRIIENRCSVQVSIIVDMHLLPQRLYRNCIPKKKKSATTELCARFSHNMSELRVQFNSDGSELHSQ